jgi:hypothetical protein
MQTEINLDQLYFNYDYDCILYAHQPKEIDADVDCGSRRKWKIIQGNQLDPISCLRLAVESGLTKKRTRI